MTVGSALRHGGDARQADDAVHADDAARGDDAVHDAGSSATDRSRAAGRVYRIRRRDPVPATVVPLGTLAAELDSLVRLLRRSAESTTCLDARAAAEQRLASLEADRLACLALPVDQARRLRVRLRHERESLERSGLACRHVVTPRY